MFTKLVLCTGRVALGFNFGGFVSFLAGLFGFILAGTDIRRNSYMMDNFGRQKFRWTILCLRHTDTHTDTLIFFISIEARNEWSGQRGSSHESVFRSCFWSREDGGVEWRAFCLVFSRLSISWTKAIAKRSHANVQSDFRNQTFAQEVWQLIFCRVNVSCLLIGCL